MVGGSMKVLWLINILLEEQSKYLDLEPTPIGGWILGLMDGLRDTEVEITICSVSSYTDEIRYFTKGEISYVIVPFKKDLTGSFRKVLDTVNPDLTHIFGTEIKHTRDMLMVADLDKTMVQTQGLAFVCNNLYDAGLPLEQKIRCYKKNSLQIGGVSLYQQKKGLETAGKWELEALARAKHILLHSNWDDAHISMVSPNAVRYRYEKYDEILRPEFYSGTWKYENCWPYSIFMSQAATPFKGMNMLLQIMPDIIKAFPLTHLYVAGFYPSIRNYSKYQIENFEYFNFIQTEIKRLKLEENVSFLGPLDVNIIKQYYLRANVFTSCSIIENTCNSLMEAKMLGVPSISSYVGGLQDRIEHGIDGFFYPFNEPELMGYYIKKIFASPELATQISAAAAKNAKFMHDRDGAVQYVLNIYRKLLT